MSNPRVVRVLMTAGRAAGDAGARGGLRRPADVLARCVIAVLASCAVSLAGAQSAQSASGAPGAHQTAPFVAPQWAFPTAAPPHPAPVRDSVVRHHVPGSARTFTMARAANAFDVADWFPDSHAPMPRPVRYGHSPEWRACGFCHLPDGRGRPENATLAGLPADYIRAQVKALANRSRLSANPSSSTNSMHQIAAAAPDSDVAIAARYFSAQTLTRRNRVVETMQVPTTRVEGILYALDGEGTEPIAGRLIEVPEDFERHELHDPSVTYVTYVPRGSLARGRRLVTTGPAGPATACITCHGPQLRGVAMVPPIAGRSPSYLLRQLMNIKAGARHDAGSAPMLPVVEKLSVSDMVALAAYVGSLAPSPTSR